MTFVHDLTEWKSDAMHFFAKLLVGVWGRYTLERNGMVGSNECGSTTNTIHGIQLFYYFFVRVVYNISLD